MRKTLFFSSALMLSSLLSSLLSPVIGYSKVDVDSFPVLKELTKTLIEQDGFSQQEIDSIFSRANIEQRTLDLMNAQYEAKPWYQYRQIFLNKKRIRNGAIFWNRYEEVLNRAESVYGVPPQVIVAIIGVETYYGENMGSYRVLDSLTTLSSSLPRRSDYFTGELRTFLNTVRKENIEADSVEGSFAGAIGIPQFMPSSYEAYSVDFNANGKRDLVNEPEDAIGSVANYLVEHGWQRGQATFADVQGDLPATAKQWVSTSVRGGKGKPQYSLAQLKQTGVKFDAKENASNKAALYSFVMPQEQSRYVVAYDNFYAITRYNHSVNYAMAVLELSQEIYTLFNQRQD